MKKIISALIILFISSFLYAEKIVFSASSMVGQTGNSNATTKLIGAAFVQTASIEISAEKIEMSGENYRYIKAEGNISGKNLDTNMEFTCDSLEFDRDTKIAILKGDVTLTDIENDVKAQAQIIEYNQETEIAVLQIQVKLIQKDNTCNGAYAIYQKNKQLLEISGNAQVKQKNDIFRAQQISLNMDTQEISLSGNVKGSVTQEDKKDDSN